VGGHKIGVAYASYQLGRIARAQGDAAGARTSFAAGLRLFRELGQRRGVAFALVGLAGTAAPGQERRAARLLGAAAALQAALGVALDTGARAEYERAVAAARAALGEEEFAAAWAEGRGLSPEQAVAYALEDAPAEA
jgi:hypothetical protein